MSIARTDNSTLGRWWWTVDKWMLVALLALAAIGVVLAMAASPPVAERIGLDPLHFVQRQAVYLPMAVVIMLGVSLMSPVGARRLAIVVFLGAVVLLIMTLAVGSEIKELADGSISAVSRYNRRSSLSRPSPLYVRGCSPQKAWG